VPKTNEEIKIKQAVWPPSLADTVCPRPSVTQTFDQTGVRVASKVGNFRSKFGHARPMGSRIIRYVHDGRTDRGTDKSNAFCPLPYQQSGAKQPAQSTTSSVLARFMDIYYIMSQKNKKLSCRRETAQCFVSLNISPSHSRSLKVIRNDIFQ